MKIFWHLALRFTSAQELCCASCNNILLVIFFYNINFFQLAHISADSFCFPFGESNLECPGIRKDYGNISTGKVCLDSNEGQMEDGLMGPRRKVFPQPLQSLNYDKPSCYWVCLILFERFFFCSLKNKKKNKATCLYFQWLSWEILAWRTRQNCGCFPPFWCKLSNRSRYETQKQICAWEQSQNFHSNSAGGPPLLWFVHLRFCPFKGKLKTLWEFFSGSFFFLILHKLWFAGSVPLCLPKKLFFFFSSVNTVCISLKFKLLCFLFNIKELEQLLLWFLYYYY